MSGLRPTPSLVAPFFVDVEASGLGPSGFPVEVGWASPEWHMDGTCSIRLRSVLVKPTAEWLAGPGAWDPNAEWMHGLSREDLLRDGLEPATLCDLLDTEFSGRRVHTDTGGGGMDDLWIALLYEAAGREPAGWAVERETAEEAHATHLAEMGLSARAVWPRLRFVAPEPTHAAAENALVEAWLWAMTEQVGRSPVRGRSDSEQRALMRRLGEQVPAVWWPRLAAGSVYRRLRTDPAHPG